jgi:Fe-S oxidoreductase
MLWDDCFVRHHEPQIGRAAVRVLEAAGYEVALLRHRLCCGRPAFSQGNLDEARRLGAHNLDALAAAERHRGFETVVFLEPSCWSMFAEDYRELKLKEAGDWPARCLTFEQFIDGLLQREPGALNLRPQEASIAIHGHCHAKALAGGRHLAQLAARIPGGGAQLLDTGCCGMAGAFGATTDKYELSLRVAAPLAEKIRELPAGAVVVASGTSCRQQIAHTTDARPLHMAELLAGALVDR